MSWFSATVEEMEGRRKGGNHLALVRIQAIIPQKHTEITEQPNKAKDMREKEGPEALSDSLYRTPCFHSCPIVSSLYNNQS